MAEAMSGEQLAEIRAAADRDRWSTYCGHAGPRAMVTDLLAEVDRLRAQLAEIGETGAEWTVRYANGDTLYASSESYARMTADRDISATLIRRVVGEWREVPE